MQRYVFSYINFFDNDLKSTILEAENRLSALEKGFLGEGVEISTEVFSEIYSECVDEDEKIEALKEFAFDTDSMIEAICID